VDAAEVLLLGTELGPGTASGKIDSEPFYQAQKSGV
jgi:hypothetical protein